MDMSFSFRMCGSSRNSLWGGGGGARFVLIWFRTQTSIRFL